MQGTDQASSHDRRATTTISRLLTAIAVAIVGLVIPAGAKMASAAAATLTKNLDSIQGTGFTGPNTFQAGSLVRYRLQFQCSSLSEPCGTGTITDVLDPNLDFVQIVQPTTGATIIGSTWDETSHTATVNLSNFNDGTTSEIILIARVKATAPAGTIPNDATIAVPNAEPLTTPVVDIVVPASTPTWNLTKAKTHPTNDPTVDSIVTYHVELSAPSVIGNESITSGTIVDSFPPGAVIVDADGGVVDYTNHTITWTVGPLAPNEDYVADVKLTYPSTPRVAGEPAFTAAQIVINSVAGSFNYADGSSGTLKDNSRVTLAAPVDSIETSKSGSDTENPDNVTTWYIVGTNTGNSTLVGPVVTDTPLPAGISNYFISFEHPYNVSVPETPETFEQLIGGVWQPLATWTSGDVYYGWGRHYLNPAATGVRARPTSGTAAPGEVFGTIQLSGTVDASVGTSIENCAVSTTATLTSNNPCSTTVVTSPVAAIAISKAHAYPDSSAGAITPGTVFEWAFAFNADATKGTVQKFTVADTLPKEFSFVAVDCVATYGLGGGFDQTLASNCANINHLVNEADFPAPTITPNIDGAGATGLSWSVDLTNGHFGITQVPQTDAFIIRLKVRVNDGVSVGSYTNTATFVSDMPLECNQFSITGTDTHDYLGNGTGTVDPTCNATDNVDVAAAAIIDSSKWDSGAVGQSFVDETTGQPSASCPDDGGGYTRYPCVAQTTPGGPFSYRFHLKNTGNVVATNYVMYDILPYAADTGVTQLLGGQQRGSDWQPNLTGPIQILDQAAGANATVQYNLTTNPCRPELNKGANDGVWQASCDNTWYTAAQITDWTTVRSFRLSAYQPVGGASPAWNPLDTIDLQADMKAPLSAPTSTTSPLALSIAWNSLGHREFRLNANGSTDRLLASEPRKVGVIIPFVVPDAYAVGDYVWYDTNHDGLQSAGEAAVKGVTVDLVNPDGTPALDANGQPVASTTTDANGHYVFDNLPAGTYKVVFSNLPAGFVTTTQNNAGNQTATNDSNTPAGAAGSATTPLFKIGAGLSGMTAPVKSDGVVIAVSINRTIDAGLVQSITDPALTTTVSSQTPAYGSTLSDSVVVTNTAGASMDGTWTLLGPVAPVSGSCATASWAGAATFDSGTFPVKGDGTYKTSSTKPLVAGGCYTFVDGLPATATTTAVKTTTPGLVSETALMVITYSVGDYAWYDTNGNGIQDTGELPVKGVTVKLRDSTGAALSTTTTDANGLYHFDNLPAGTYSVAFSNLPTGYQFTGQSLSGSTPQNDSNPDTSTGVTPTFVLGAPAGGNHVTASIPGDNVTAPFIDRTIDAGILRLSTPALTTTISSQTTTVGSTLSDSVVVTGTNGAATSGSWALLGPVAPGEGVCGAVSWAKAATFDSGTFDVTGDGTYPTPSTKPLTVAGCYTFTDSLEATAITTATSTTPGIVSETALVSALTPTLTTVISNQQAGLGAQISDTINVTGGAGSSLDGTWTLLGPVAPADGSCASVTWVGAPTVATGSFTVTLVKGSGTTTTPAMPLKTAGCYTYTESLTASAGTNAVPTTKPGVVSETTVIGRNVPTVVTTTSAQSASIGVTLTDDVVVTNTAGHDIAAVWTLFGPVPPVTSGSCVGVNWAAAVVFDSGTLAISGDGTYTTSASKKLVAAGCYSYAETLPATTNTAAVNAQAGVASETSLIASYSVGDFVWIDANHNGIQDAGEAPVPGDKVTLFDAAGNVVATTSTDASGHYHFDNLPAGDYHETFGLPAGYRFTTPTTGPDRTVDSNVDGMGTTATFTLGPPAASNNVTPSIPADTVTAPFIDRTIDAGIYQPVSVGDYVWIDVNRDGHQDSSDIPVAGVTVTLYRADGVTPVTIDVDGNPVAPRTTDANGKYGFGNLPPGQYVVKFSGLPNGFSVTTSQDTPAAPTDSNGVTATSVVLAGGQADLTLDLGLVSIDLSLSKSLLSSGPFVAGTATTFVLTPHNNGPVDALPGWSVTEVVPDGLRLVSMTGTGYSCDGVTCTAIAGLASGADGPVITVVATIASALPGSLHNVAFISPGPGEVNETNPLVVPTTSTDTSATPTDNDAQASLTIVSAIESLPTTGTASIVELALAAWFLAAGSLMVTVSRRRRSVARR